MTDVIARCGRKVEDTKALLTAAIARREKAFAAVLRQDGSVRHGYAAEVQSRDVHIERLKFQLAAAEEALAHAREDFARRENKRKLAAAANQEAEKLEAETAALREQLSAKEAKAARARERAAEHLASAALTANEIQDRRAASSKVREDVLASNRTRKAHGLGPDALPEAFRVTP